MKGFLKNETEVGDLGEKLLIAFETPGEMEEKETIPVLVYQDQKSLMSSPNKTLVSFMRVIFPNLTDSLSDIHLQIARIFKSVLNVRLDQDSYKLDLSQLLNDELYKVNIINTSKASNNFFLSSKLPCDFCGNPKCDNCILPNDDSLKLQDMLDKQENSEGNFALEIIFSYKIKDISSLNLCEEKEKIEDTNVLKKKKLTLYDCLDYSCRPEKLDAHNE